MNDPTTLFTYERHVDPRSLHGTTLLVTLGSFGDAGSMQQLIDDHLLNTLPSRVLGRLDLDEVFDYGAHRPEITLDRDRFVDYDAPEITLHEVAAPDGEAFYLLRGPEPTLQWERVAAALRIVVEQLGIRRTVLAMSFPAPVPHTRPMTLTRFAADPADIRAPRPMPGTFRIRSSFGALLTLRLGEAGHPVVGAVAHVPQYLQETASPLAAIALLEALHDEGGPEVPTDPLREAAEAVRENVDRQIAAAPQLREMIRALEENYDRYLLTSAEDAQVPSADEIAAEVEQFLQGLDGEGGHGEGPHDEDPGDGGRDDHGADGDPAPGA